MQQIAYFKFGRFNSLNVEDYRIRGRQRNKCWSWSWAQQPQSARIIAAQAGLAVPTSESIQHPIRAHVYDGDGRLCVKSTTLPELQDWFAAQGEKPGRADQLWRWVYGKWRSMGFRGAAPAAEGAAQSYFGGGIEHLADAAIPAADGFSAGFVERFGARLSFDGGLQLMEVTPASDGTRKLVFRVTTGEAAGGRIETVLIPWYRDYDPRVGRQEEPRYTICVSSQVGCAMNCQFCYTGRMGLSGNLTTAQIVEQVLVAQQMLQAESRAPAAAVADAARDATAAAAAGGGGAAAAAAAAAAGGGVSKRPTPPPAPPLRPGPITNVVFMGMGEPLHNPAAVFGAIDVMTHDRGLGLSAGRITLSTVGVLPQLQHFLDRFAPPPPPPSLPSPPPPRSTAPPPSPTSAASAAASATVTQTPTHASTSSPGSSPSPPFPTRRSPAAPHSARVSLAVSIHAGTDNLRAALVPSNTRLTLSLHQLPALAPPPSTPPADQAVSSSSSSSASSSAEAVSAGRAATDGSDSVSGASGGGLLRGLSALIAVLSRHYPRTDRRPLRTGRYVLFEYTMLGGVNDRPTDAVALLAATRDIECSFNLIMFNPFPGTIYMPSKPERVEAFRRILREAGRIVHVRHSKGDSGMAACGQLGDVGERPGRAGRGMEAPGGGRPGAKILPEAQAQAAAAAAAADAVAASGGSSGTAAVAAAAVVEIGAA